MFKVLIALDGSQTAEQSLILAGKLLAGKDAEVTLLHVIPRHLIYGKGGPVVSECYDPVEAQAGAQALLDSAEARLRIANVGPAIAKEIETGDPADLILAIAAEEEVDLIVMGGRGLNAVERFLFGSVSTKVVSHAHCGVLVAHPTLPAKEAEAQLPERQEALAR